MSPPTEAALWAALEDVLDPELGVDVVNLGLVYEIRVEGGAVSVLMTLTSLGCPAGPDIAKAVGDTLTALEGVESVSLDFTFDPPWSLDRLTEDGREQMIIQGFI